MSMQTNEHIYEHGGIRTRLTAVAEGILRITRTRRAAFLEESSPSVVCRGPISAQLTVGEDTVLFAAGGIVAEVSRQSGAITFRSAAGQVLLREPERRPCLLEEIPVFVHEYDADSHVEEGQSVDGARAWASPARTRQHRTAYECRQNFVFDPEEGLYGLGSHEEGYGNLRGHMQLLYQHNMKAVVPVLVAPLSRFCSLLTSELPTDSLRQSR